jgi:NAD(P)-dependent dehydrogenase (short-subunit alcohol dehydrogenase family)
VTRPVAVVTGAGSGIGAAIAQRFAATHDLLITHLEDDANVKDSVGKARDLGAQVDIVFGDLCDQRTLDQLVAAIQSHGARLEVLVCNAGAYPRVHWHEITHPQLRDSIALNLTAHLIAVHAATPHLTARGHGRIVLISSVLTQIGRVDLTHYIAAKGGLEAAAHALARELGPYGVTINTVRPGSIEVPAEHTVVSDHMAMVTRQLARQCVQRRGHPEDIAAAVFFLASPEADFITGQTLTVDGGWHLT